LLIWLEIDDVGGVAIQSEQERHRFAFKPALMTVSTGPPDLDRRSRRQMERDVPPDFGRLRHSRRAEAVPPTIVLLETATTRSSGSAVR
jgi:hypothetical protein